MALPLETRPEPSQQPEVALLVNERTLLPVATPLAPARTLMTRFPEALGPVLEAVGVPVDLAIQEVAAMSDGTYAKTANRSVVGAMTEFTFLADAHRDRRGTPDLLELSIRLAGTPCGPLTKSHDFPDQEVRTGPPFDRDRLDSHLRAKRRAPRGGAERSRADPDEAPTLMGIPPPDGGTEMANLSRNGISSRGSPG